MGLFSILFGKKPAQPTVSVSVTASKRIIDSTSAEYISERAGVIAEINRLSPPIAPDGSCSTHVKYQVVGKKSTTNRKNTKTFFAKSEDHARSIAYTMDLIEPLDITLCPTEPPIEADVNELSTAGIRINQTMGMKDVAVIKYRYEHRDDRSLPPDYIDFVIEHSETLGPTSYYQGFKIICEHLDTMDKRDLGVLICHSVNCQKASTALNGTPFSENIKMYFYIADKLLCSSELAEKINAQNIEPSQSTKLYKFITQQIEAKPKISLDDQIRDAKSRKGSQSGTAESDSVRNQVIDPETATVWKTTKDKERE